MDSSVARACDEAPGIDTPRIRTAGRDRRSPARREKDRSHHPLDTAGNLLFAAGATVVLGALTLALLSLNG